MPRFHRTVTATLAASALLGALAFNAQAQPAASSQPQATAAKAPYHGPRAGSQDRAQMHAERMQRLKTILQLQPNQQAAFDQYVQATTPQPRAAKAERPDWSRLTTPERLELAQKMRQARMAQAEQRAQATRSFYSSLSTSQQKAFDALTARGHGPHKPGHGPRGQQRSPMAQPAGAAAG